MTTEVRKEVTTLIAGADLTDAASLHKAIAVGGTIAATNATTVGLLKSKGKTGEAITVAYEGEMKAVAGASVSAGARLIITTSGFVITATDSRSNCGRALEAANSGDLFRALLDFTNCT